MVLSWVVVLLAEAVGLNAARFRAGIRKAMRLGMPNNAPWPVFFVPVVGVVDGVARDASGVPYDLSELGGGPEFREVTGVLCAVEDRPSEETPWLKPGELLLTFLDEEWESVRGFAFVERYLPFVEAPVRFVFDRVLLGTGLDTVDVVQVLCRSEDVV